MTTTAVRLQANDVVQAPAGANSHVVVDTQRLGETHRILVNMRCGRQWLMGSLRKTTSISCRRCLGDR